MAASPSNSIFCTVWMSSTFVENIVCLALIVPCRSNRTVTFHQLMYFIPIFGDRLVLMYFDIIQMLHSSQICCSSYLVNDIRFYSFLLFYLHF